MPTSSFPDQPAAVSADADLARDVSLRLEQWYAAHGLDLPPDAQAGFVEMGVEAVSRYPERPRDAVLDELIAELDQHLAAVASERTARESEDGPLRSRLARLFGRAPRD